MKKSLVILSGICLVFTISSIGLSAQARQRAQGGAADRREDVRDRREDVVDQRENVRDAREDVRDRREDVIDRRIDGGPRDKAEDVRDRREDVRDRREDVRDRREDVRDRLEDRIDRDPRFADRIHRLLPPNRSLGDAAGGFSNQGQFISALHASNNLNIPFDELKAKMTGLDGMPLGKAIQSLRPNMNERNIRDAVRKAEEQANQTDKG